MNLNFSTKKNLGVPDIAQAIIIIRSNAAQIAARNSWPKTNLWYFYNDWINKTKVAYDSTHYVTT